MAVSDDFLAFLDTETGGLVPGKDPVIEIATILTDMKLRELGRFDAKIQLRAGDVVSPEAAAVNGYDPAVWAREAVPIEEYRAFLGKHIPRGSVAVSVGHNVSFDRDMIDLGYFKPRGWFLSLSYHKVDTVGLAMAMKLAGIISCPNVKLTTVSAALGIPHAHAHSAMGDCLASKAVFEKAISILRPPEVLAS